MIGHQQKDKKQGRREKLGDVHATTPATEKNVSDVSNMVVDPEVDKFSSKYFVPEKHKEDESRLANSILPPFK